MPALAIEVTSFFNYKIDKQSLLKYEIATVYKKVNFAMTVIKKDKTESAT